MPKSVPATDKEKKAVIWKIVTEQITQVYEQEGWGAEVTNIAILPLQRGDTEVRVEVEGVLVREGIAGSFNARGIITADNHFFILQLTGPDT
ncbi:MAG TPA: hypothetical protein VKK79_18880, partial [Candidatus Lokiarchaeia archaeon]|nr:hypothetical protein [Candidatus Lokiarchaeia archaeon]